MPLDDNEAWLHPIKAISVKKDKPGVPRPEGTYDSGHEPSDEDELHDYQAHLGLLGDPHEDIGQSSTHPPPPQQPSEATPSSPTPDLEDPVLTLTERFDAFWDETQEHRVLLTQDMEALRADMRTVLANQCRYSSATVVPPGPACTASCPPPATATTVTCPITRRVPSTFFCYFIASGDTTLFCLGGGGGGGVGGARVFLRFVSCLFVL